MSSNPVPSSDAEIVALLDQLALVEGQLASLADQKRIQLESVGVSDEVQSLVRQNAAHVRLLEKNFSDSCLALEKEAAVALEAIVVPVEIREALAAIDAQRKAVTDRLDRDRRFLADRLDRDKSQAELDLEIQTSDSFNSVALQRDEINAEFAGPIDSANAAMLDLQEKIKVAVKAFGRSVKGSLKMAVFNRGRVSWNTVMLDAWIVDHPFLSSARSEGEPSVSIRGV